MVEFEILSRNIYEYGGTRKNNDLEQELNLGPDE
jgi:hypothetical protein